MICTDPWWVHDVRPDGTCDGRCAESPHGTTESSTPDTTEANTRTVGCEEASEGRPHGALTPGRPSDLTRDEAEMDRTTGVRKAAADLLEAHREATERNRRAGLHIVTASRRAGMTYAEIGHHLGMTEGGVRMMLRRAAGGER